jgi:hypothetical protein
MPEHQPSRYLVYLDGIGQFKSTYSPEVEQFLAHPGAGPAGYGDCAGDYALFGAEQNPGGGSSPVGVLAIGDLAAVKTPL